MFFLVIPPLRTNAMLPPFNSVYLCIGLRAIEHRNLIQITFTSQNLGCEGYFMMEIYSTVRSRSTILMLSRREWMTRASPLPSELYPPHYNLMKLLSILTLVRFTGIFVRCIPVLHHLFHRLYLQASSAFVISIRWNQIPCS
ncbi:hypothetical protein D3C76_453010 [compost metagenome]